VLPVENSELWNGLSRVSPGAFPRDMRVSCAMYSRASVCVVSRVGNQIEYFIILILFAGTRGEVAEELVDIAVLNARSLYVDRFIAAVFPTFKLPPLL